MKKYYFFIVMLFSMTFGRAQDIVVRRSMESDECIMGYLYVNKKFIGYTLERDDKKILPGKYSAYIRTDNDRGWRIELLDVPGNKTRIQIHIGNYPFQSTGCILVGSSANLSNCTVLGSAAAMQKLEEAVTSFNIELMLERNSSQQFPITVIYE